MVRGVRERVVHALTVRLLKGRRTNKLVTMKAAQQVNGQQKAVEEYVAGRMRGEKALLPVIRGFLRKVKAATKQELKGTLTEQIARVWQWTQQESNGVKDDLEARRKHFARQHAVVCWSRSTTNTHTVPRHVMHDAALTLYSNPRFPTPL